MMKRMHNEAILNQASRFQLLRSKLMGMFIVVSGVNQAGVTLATADLGIVQVLKNGIQKYNFDFDALQQSHNALEMGAIEAVSVAGAAFRFTLFVPFVNYFDSYADDVALDIVDNNQWEIVHNFPACTAALIVSGNVAYYGFKADDCAVSPYELQIINHHFSIAGAGAFTFPIYAENVTYLYLEKDAAITNVSVLKDGLPFLDVAPLLDVNSVTNLISHNETYNATLPYLKIPLNPTKEEVGAYAKDIEVSVTATGACTLKCLVISQFSTPDRLNRSVVTRNIAVETKINNKPNIPQQVKSYVKAQRVGE